VLPIFRTSSELTIGRSSGEGRSQGVVAAGTLRGQNSRAIGGGGPNIKTLNDGRTNIFEDLHGKNTGGAGGPQIQHPKRTGGGPQTPFLKTRNVSCEKEEFSGGRPDDDQECVFGKEEKKKNEILFRRCATRFALPDSGGGSIGRKERALGGEKEVTGIYTEDSRI